MLHEYGTLDEVKSELSWLVSELKAGTFKGRTVPFLTEGADLGSRNIIGKGWNNFIKQNINTGKGTESSLATGVCSCNL